MEMFETALGRLVPVNEVQTVLEDAILRLLFEYRMNPQNGPDNVPMKLSHIARAVSAEQNLVPAALDALQENQPPLVEEGDGFPGERVPILLAPATSVVASQEDIVDAKVLLDWCRERVARAVRASQAMKP